MFLHSVKGLDNFTVTASDGDVGTIDDVYFDDEKWAIRYLVVDTGDWLSKRDVLISPIAIQRGDWAVRTMYAQLTRQQVRDSPGIDTAGPVSRQQEAELHRHYGYPYYWSGPYMWGDTVFPGVLEETPSEEPEEQRAIGHAAQVHESADPHLCSSKDVTGYAIRTTDGTVGHVEDFLFDDEDWSIQYIVVDPRNWWPGKHVLVSPQRIDHVNRDEACVVVNISRDELEHSQKYDSRSPPPSTTRPPPDLRR